MSPSRALTLSWDSGKPLPRVPELEALYRHGVEPRHGSVIMVVGRSGTQKSGFALFWTEQMNLPTLYFSADMSAFTASARLASMATQHTTNMVETNMAAGGEYAERYTKALASSNLQFSFGAPITWRAVNEELEAWVELHNSYPEVIVFDNLMDFEGAEASYEIQMGVMQDLTALARDTGAAVIIMHHASDKTFEAKSNPWNPPSREQVKGGLSEKAELTLSVALDPHTYAYRVATIKQRSGPADPTAQSFATLRAEPEYTRFGPFTATYNQYSDYTPGSAETGELDTIDI